MSAKDSWGKDMTGTEVVPGVWVVCIEEAL